MPASNPSQQRSISICRGSTLSGHRRPHWSRDPGELTSIKGVVCATKKEFGTGSSKLETEDRRGHGTIRNESLERRGRVIVRYGLEAHAH